MAALGAQSIASSYEQLLQVDRDGGGNTTTHVSVKDGDNGTTFGFTIATDALMMSSTNRLEFGDTGTFIHQSADGVLDLVSDTEIEINATTIDMNGALDLSGNAQLSGTVTVGADGSGTDVIFYSGTAGDNFTWDASEEKLTITGTNGQTALDVADGNVTIADDLAVDGTSNLDNTDIDGTFAVDGATISLDATTSLNIDNTNTTNGITVGTATSAVPISIGHTTSVVTVNDELDVTGTVDINDTTDSSSKTTGALKVDGGVGVALKLFVGTDLDVDGTANLDIVDIDGAVNMAADLTSTANIIIDADDKGLTLGADQDVTFYADDAGTAYLVRGVDVTPTAGEATGWMKYYLGSTSSSYLSIIGGASGDAELYLLADSGDINDDQYKLVSNASGYFAIQSKTSGSWAAQLVIDASTALIYTNYHAFMVNENSNAGNSLGVTINQAAADNEIISLKSSDVGHGRTTYTETDTYGHFRKVGNATGGLQIIANMEDVDTGYVMSITASGGQADTTKSASAHGLVKIWSEEHDGSNAAANITANGNIFAVSGYIGGANSTVFLVDEDGDIHYDGSDAGAYDYAEMFEWEDGNPDNEDRVGYSVSLVGEKIKKAEEGETVVGIVSAVPAVCGDSPMEWQKRYKTDEWGRKIHKEVDCVKFEIQHESEPATYYQEGDDLPEGKEVGDEKTAAVYITKEKHYEGDAIPSELPDDAVSYKKLISQNSDDYDAEQEYIPRKERKEWSPVGLVGKLRMRKGQPTASSWIKMKDEGNNIEMYFVK